MAEKGFWSRLFGAAAPAAPTLSFAELTRLHAVLLEPENQVVNATNKATLIETLRALAELLIWGDQNDPRVFEFFLEHNMLKHFRRILEVPAHRRGDVAVQLLQARARSSAGFCLSCPCAAWHQGLHSSPATRLPRPVHCAPRADGLRMRAGATPLRRRRCQARPRRAALHAGHATTCPPQPAAGARAHRRADAVRPHHTPRRPAAPQTSGVRCRADAVHSHHKHLEDHIHVLPLQ